MNSSASLPIEMQATAHAAGRLPQVAHRRVKVRGVEIFYREAGMPSRPTILLLHGFPSASHQYRRLIDALAAECHVIAPDYPGFGFSDAPAPASAGGSFRYSFDHLAELMAEFCSALALRKFFLYAFDYGGPVGFRVATRHPEWIAGLILQNANAYEEGLSPLARQLASLRPGAPGAEQTVLDVLTLAGTRAQYETGARVAEHIAPESWFLDQALLEQPGRKAVQVELALVYHSNVARYPEWQAWLRAHQPPALIAWGRRDPFFLEAGARAYLRDLPDAELHLFDTGHFALEEHAAEIADRVARFVTRVAAVPIVGAAAG